MREARRLHRADPGVLLAERRALARCGVGDGGASGEGGDKPGWTDRAGLRGLIYHPRHGVKLGDVITHIDKEKVRNFDDLYNILSEKKPGDEVAVKFLRKGRLKTEKIRLTVVNVTS